MTKSTSAKLAAEYLSKKAAEESMGAPAQVQPQEEQLQAALAAGAPEAQHEAAEAPGQEQLEHAIGAEPSANEGDEIDQLLSQLSPEELEQLAAELAADMGGAHAGADAGAGHEDVGQLAQAIQAHLAQNPEAGLGAEEGIDPAQLEQKTAALNFVKSAEYIEGFLNQAIDRGYNVKQAVDMYDHALTQTVQAVKQAEFAPKQEVEKVAEEIDTKTAAYYEGVIERAREYGLSDSQALEFVKSAAPSPRQQANLARVVSSGKARLTPKGLDGVKRPNPMHKVVNSPNPAAAAAEMGIPYHGPEAAAAAAAAPAAQSAPASAAEVQAALDAKSTLAKLDEYIKSQATKNPYLSLGGAAAGGAGLGMLGAGLMSDDKK